MSKELQDEIEMRVDKGFSLLVDLLSSGVNYDLESLHALLNFHRDPQLSRKVLERYQKVGDTLMEEGRIDDASCLFYCLTLLSPLDSDAWLRLGNSYYHNKKYDEAIIAYTSATVINKNDYRGHLWSAYSFQKLNQVDNALIALEKAIQMLGGTTNMALLIEAESFKSHLEQSRR